MPYPNEHSCRLRNPDKYDEIKRVNGDREHNGKAYDVIYGRLGSEWEDQAYRYKTENWTESEARSHCSDHGGEFHPAGSSAAGICPDKIHNALAHVYQDLHMQPAAMEACGLNAMKSSIRCALERLNGRQVNSELLDFIFFFGDEDRSDNKLQVESGIAVIPITRPLTNVPADHFLVRYGVYNSYDQIRQKYWEAQNDSDVSAILYRIDSPGGLHAGMMDLVDELYANRGKKPIVAMVDEDMFSAAYGVGSTADEIWITRSSAVGSIGTLLVHEEESQWLKDRGFTVTDFTYGRKKAQAAPWKPLSDEAKADLQATVDAAGKEFTEAVARNLGVKFEAVRSLEAGIYEGRKAIDIGLAGRMVSSRSALEEMKTLYGRK